MLRPATDTDTETIRRWRNHPTVRAASLWQHEITPAEHAAWWQRTTADPSTRLLVYVHDGVDSGVVTFTDVDPVARSASWGFYLDVDGLEERGDTLTAWLGVAGEALDHAFVDLDLEVLTGDVLADNTAVRRMNRRFGFTEGEAEEREFGGRTVRSLPIRMHRSDRKR
jgi:UDP-4-amino-4,6-dideoxy-N-acetyl-beta-L-altrosamine N-acetyltransferase